jgi:excisionase family DNA binding protein
MSRPSKSGRQDLNLRPLGPEGSLSVSDTVRSGPMESQGSDIPGVGSSVRSDTDRPNRCDPGESGTFWAQRTLREVGPLLTVREVAERLRVCRATVYRMVAEGRLAAVRVSSGAIRVLPGNGVRGRMV